MSEYIYPVLKWIASTSQGPTKASRFLFLCSASMALVSSSIFRVQFSVDDISADMNIVLPSKAEDDLYNIFKASLTPSMTALFPGAIFPTFVVPAKCTTVVLTLRSLVSQFLANRNSDGSNASMPVTLPNGDRVIIPGTPLGDPLPHPTKWTPLSIGGATKNFLTPQWGFVRGIVPSITSYETIASDMFPTDEQRERETDEITNLQYTNEERMIAEIWAGGPGTVTPPGIWNMLAMKAMNGSGIKWNRQVQIYFLLNASTFQASIVAWKIKRTFMQQRPIQVIMQRTPSTINNWDGDVSSTVWTPYQETNFVTPPFPDYISGHSTFSASASAVLSECLGVEPVDVDTMFSKEELQLISPMFDNTKYNTPFCNLSRLFFAPNVSNIDAEYPYTITCLSYNTWTQMANECGKSRIYGGIHTQCANGVGLLLGDMIGKDIMNMYKNLV